MTDFAAGLGSLSAGPEGERDNTVGMGEGDEDSIWLLLLLLLLLWCALCIIFLLVLYHRKKKEEEDAANTLQPYLNKASGAGALVPLVDGDVSDSSELERRDYALPVGIYEVPDRTEESDRERDDFSWALSGEDVSVAEDAYGARAGAAQADADDSEVGREDTYKQSRLAKMGAGDAGATDTKREFLGTEYDLEGDGDEGNQVRCL